MSSSSTAMPCTSRSSPAGWTDVLPSGGAGRPALGPGFPPTIVAAAEFSVEPAAAAVPTIQPVDLYDLSDLLTDSTLLTLNLITVKVNPDGTRWTSR